MNIKIDSRIFNDIYIKHALTNKRRIQIYYGGSSSGKSYAIVGQRTVLDLLSGKRNYLICRNTGSTIEHSVWNEVVSAIYNFKVQRLFELNKTARVITCKLNKKQAIFKGLDDVQKIKSIRPIDGPITDILIEEATELSSLSIIKDLMKRQRGKTKTKKRLTLIFNPIYKTHFIYKEYFKGFWDEITNEQFQANDQISILKATYKDNIRFLSQDDINDLENETDRYYYEVYTLGNWGVIGNLIFKNWRVADLTAVRQMIDNPRHGLDWGFAKDPFAYIHSEIDNKRKKIYLLDEVCAPELSNEEAAALIKPYCGFNIVKCDSSEPKSIAEFRTKYHINAVAAKKGPGSVVQGIKFLQRYEIIIDTNCQNAQNEFSLYKFKENKDGEVLPLPVDKNNHIIDGVRYSTETDILEHPGILNLRK